MIAMLKSLKYTLVVFMPQETKTKNHKLALPYHGPFRVLEVRGNCVLVRPVDKPDENPILVSVNRVTPCPVELPDQSWLGTSGRSPSKTSAVHQLPSIVQDTHQNTHYTRSKVQGRTSD